MPCLCSNSWVISDRCFAADSTLLIITARPQCSTEAVSTCKALQTRASKALPPNLPFTFFTSRRDVGVFCSPGRLQGFYAQGRVGTRGLGRLMRRSQSQARVNLRAPRPSYEEDLRPLDVSAWPAVTLLTEIPVASQGYCSGIWRLTGSAQGKTSPQEPGSHVPSFALPTEPCRSSDTSILCIQRLESKPPGAWHGNVRSGMTTDAMRLWLVADTPGEQTSPPWLPPFERKKLWRGGRCCHYLPPGESSQNTRERQSALPGRGRPRKSR